MSNFEKFLSNAAKEFEECPFDTYNGIKLGKGYSVVSSGDVFINSNISKCNSNTMTILITILAHANVEGIAFPSDSRIAILSGISVDSAREAIDELIKIGLCSRESNGYIRVNKRHSRDSGDFDFFQGIVFRGIWSVLPPAAKKLLLYYCWKSKPFSNIDDKFHRATVEEQKRSKEDFGRRMVPLEDLCPTTIEEILGISERTRRNARKFLDAMGLTYGLEGRDGLVLENNLQLVYPSVFKRLAHAKRSASEVTGGTLRSARAGKVIQAQLPGDA